MTNAIGRKKLPSLGAMTWPMASLLLLLLFNSAFNRDFFGGDNALKVLTNSCLVAVIGIGMTLVIATGGVDLSVGSVMALAGAAAAYVMKDTAQPWYILGTSLGAALGLGALCGAWNGFLVAIFKIQPIVATLIFMVAGRGVAEWIAQNKNMPVNDPRFLLIWNGHTFGIATPIFIAVGLLCLTALLTRKTALGLFIEAVGDNQVASRYAGINARMVLFLVYIFSGACAGLGGAMVVSNVHQLNPTDAGLGIELDAILATVLGGNSLTGGKFSLLGTLVGSVVIESLNQTLNMIHVPSPVAPFYKGLIILTVCMLQSPTFRATTLDLLKRVRATMLGMFKWVRATTLGILKRARATMLGMFKRTKA